jgi:hypothetical protein
MTPSDEYFHYKEEPVKSMLLRMREHILALGPDVAEAWKYRMPFFCYKGKMFCYLWVHRDRHQPYIGFVEGRQLEHPRLLQEGRARMKIFFLEEPLPLADLDALLQQALALAAADKQQ